MSDRSAVNVEVEDAFFQLADHPNTRLLTVNEYIVHDDIEYGDRLSYGHTRTAERFDTTYMVELLSYSDYGGSSCDAANVRSLLRIFGEESFVHLTGSHGSTGLALLWNKPLPGDDAEQTNLKSLVNIMANLLDYPVISDEDHSEYESEMFEQAWDSYLYQDTFSELEDLAPDDAQRELLDTTSPDAIWEMYSSYERLEIVCEDAVSAVNLTHDETVKHVARELFGWSV